MASELKPEQKTLPRILGPFDAYTLVIGGIIGSGIFLKPKDIAASLGELRLIILVWLSGGLVALFGSLALAELAAMLPHAGGPYVYLRTAFGRFPAFLWGWAEFWIIRTASLAALATASVVYFSKIVPMSNTQQEVAVMGIIAFLSALNYVSTRGGASLQNLTVVLKIGFILAVAGIGFSHGSVANRDSLVAPSNGNFFLAFGTAFVAVWWAYDGWINIGPVAEEVKDPQKNVPRALILGMATIIGLYILATVSYHFALPMSKISISSAVAVDACNAALGSKAALFVAIGVAISTFGAANTNLLTGPRITFAAARDGLLPAALQRVHSRFQTPANSVLLQGVWSLVLIWGAFHFSSGSGAANKYFKTADDAFDFLTNYAVFGGSIFYSLAVAAVFVLRRTMPDAPRPYRTWGYPYTTIVYLIGFLGLIVSLLIEKPRESAGGLVLLALGSIYYAWAVRRPAAQATANVRPDGSTES